MIRGLLLTVSVALAGGGPALAQSHPGSHPAPPPITKRGTFPSTRPTMPPCMPYGSGATGAFSFPLGVSSGVDLSIGHDSLRKVMLKLSTAQPLRAGAATDVMMQGDSLRWTQDLAGTSCKATAAVSAATPLVPEMLRGTMACEHGELAFTLHKKPQ